MPKPSNNIRSISQLITDSNDILQSLITQSQQLKSIEDIITDIIPVIFNVGSIKSQKMTLIVSKATDATNIKYQEEQIISTLAKANIAIEEIKVKVRPILDTIRKKPPSPKISENASKIISIYANEVKDQGIQEALVKLSKTLGKNSQGETTNPS
ncbi:MAG: hypothetical protein CMQ40_04265 [Gammaproteobacteria bacterium]|nr:hypothetical protein [Gammaproteobacteria bacterium]|tara:strand:- start:702 stop:1166 length:465 start_codon:yes stop_codon:yes gene_type:complete